MSSGTAPVLFDIDGTLVDAYHLHIHPWCRVGNPFTGHTGVFVELGVGVESWRIHRFFGMDGSELVKFLIAAAGETPSSVRRN